MPGSIQMILSIILLWTCFSNTVSRPPVDPSGYVLYCPCMGRFGNQADHFLGSLAFAHGLNRTLVLPPWVEYDYSQPNSIQIPFNKYFNVEPLRKYHRVMTMEEFMTTLAPDIWPPGQRTVFCYTSRHGSKDGGCNAKDGNPFGPFWDTFKVEFDRSEFYGPLSFSTWESHHAQKWNMRYPPARYPVIAFTGAPAAFPVEQRNVGLHRYLEWSDYIADLASAFIRDKLGDRKFVGIHMRNGADWINVCKHVKDSTGRHLFASAQCLGYDFEHGQVTEELCFPPEKTVLKQIKAAVKRLEAGAVFVATDSNPMLQAIDKALKGKVRVVQLLPSEPHVDLAILGRADHYIGNCISTFSAFTTRERKSRGLSVEFWAFNNHQQSRTSRSDEL